MALASVANRFAAMADCLSLWERPSKPSLDPTVRCLRSSQGEMVFLTKASFSYQVALWEKALSAPTFIALAARLSELH